MRILFERATAGCLSVALFFAIACGDDDSTRVEPSDDPSFFNADDPIPSDSDDVQAPSQPGLDSAGDDTSDMPGETDDMTAGDGFMGPVRADGGVDMVACPDMAPADGDACDGSGFGGCDYDTASCRCRRGEWDCQAPRDPGCPRRTPDTGGACDVEGTTCSFRRADCTCSAGAWACDEGDPADDDDDDAGAA